MRRRGEPRRGTLCGYPVSEAVQAGTRKGCPYKNRHEFRQESKMAKKILVVDDMEQNRLLLRDVLEYFGYEVVEAGNGAEGVRMAREHLPDLILMDMSMPVMDGYAALRILRNDPLTRKLRVVAITSFTEEDENRNVYTAGADGFIPKPIDIRKLPAMVEEIMASKKTATEKEAG